MYNNAISFSNTLNVGDYCRTLGAFVMNLYAIMLFLNNLFAVQNLKMALKKANILQHTKSFFV